jgi:ribonuclease MRP protein subunit RMP1
LDKRENETGKDKGFENSTTFLREWLLPRCWVAFSGLVGDNQYAALGLMLLGTLARLGRVLGLDLKSEVADEGVDVGGEQGREESVVELGHESGWVDEDCGVPVAREEMVKIEETQSKESERAHEKTDGETVILKAEKPPAKVKRRKKNLDAIDELFSGLL